MMASFYPERNLTSILQSARTDQDVGLRIVVSECAQQISLALAGENMAMNMLFAVVGV